jgi:lipoprotein-anchoring transpeptidase ErfK/SrfK
MLRVTLLIWTLTTGLAQEPGATIPNASRADTSTPTVSEVLAAQIMLDRSGFSPGEIDGRAGPNFRKAVAAFQKSRGLRVSGSVDETTALRLHEESGDQPAVVTYALTEEDVAGPFQPDIPNDLVEQSKLDMLGYRNALESLAERFHASPALLQTLNADQTFATAGEQVVVPNVKITKDTDRNITRGADTKIVQDAEKNDEAASSNVRIVVTKSTSALTVEDEKGHVLFYAPVTTGSSHDPLPIGTWTVNGVQQMPAFHYNPKLFWDADPSHSKAKIAPGPNNPVGVAWIDISKEHYGIHGTPEPSTVGHVQSHGCVRMTNWDVRRVIEWAKPGTPVIFL